MIVTVMYQLAAGQKFDLDYYLKTHMPMVEKLWGPLGLKSAKVLQGTGTPTGGPAVQHVIALLDFESLDAFKNAGRLHGKEVLGDIPNFTDAQAAIQFNETLAF
jgi:uncharacterized protein (TIGR02118 family)